MKKLFLVVGFVISSCLAAADVVDDFSANDWQLGNQPGKIEAQKGALKLTELPGGGTWCLATKGFRLDPVELPFLSVTVAETKSGEVKVNFRDRGIRERVLGFAKPGVYIIDLKRFGLKGDQRIQVELYSSVPNSHTVFSEVLFSQTRGTGPSALSNAEKK